MSKTLIEIPYLEKEDVAPGQIQRYVGNGKPVLLMIQGDFCHFCDKAKPVFQQVAKELQGNVVCATIQTDGQGREASQAFPSEGVPAFFGFNSAGQLAKKFEGERTVGSLKNFALSLSK